MNNHGKLLWTQSRLTAYGSALTLTIPFVVNAEWPSLLNDRQKYLKKLLFAAIRTHLYKCNLYPGDPATAVLDLHRPILHVSYTIDPAPPVMMHKYSEYFNP